ncbi:uncharacterized protein LOC131664652 [Phymastichus coffea]|uniref:uncharacterized protein LOC131664652 n=1 Tax=Phymastichus coffea TaxID=108790 RepID=UPI00273C896A|nr:uncharacterized protein LOC131664652 [Phymastichus coffea]
MLKWTVSRSLSTASSTPHGPSKTATRRPFRDLSNTPPASSGSSKIAVSSSASASTTKRTPSKKRRCRSQGSDLRGYFQATKPNLRSGKRQSMSQRTSSPVIESFYQSTPRVDADIGPLTLFAHPTSSNRRHDRCQARNSSTSLTLPADPQVFKKTYLSNSELPQNLVNEARANNLQSHVSDFFQQIAMATSPEDVMQSDSLSNRRRYASAREHGSHASCLPRLARITKLNARNKTPYRTITIGDERRRRSGGDDIRQTPIAGKLLSLKLDQPMYENTDNTVTEVLNSEQATSAGVRSVAEILLKDSAEPSSPSSPQATKESSEAEEQHADEAADSPLDVAKAAHNDSSVSSASQLLENPSPISWAFCSPSSDLDNGEFTLKRQRGIRRKRVPRNNDNNLDASSKRPKKDKMPLIEAVNRHVKRLALETDLDSLNLVDDENPAKLREHQTAEKRKEEMEIEDEGEEDGVATRKALAKSQSKSNATQRHNTTRHNDTTISQDQPSDSQLPNNKRKDTSSRPNAGWETDSPRSSLLDSFATTTTTATCTPESTPLVATVRRCLKYSPETPNSNNSGGIANRGSIEIECQLRDEEFHVKIIRCRDLRRAYEGPIHAYVKASLRERQSGESGPVKRTAVHRATPAPAFHETLVLPCPPAHNNNYAARQLSLDIAVWHRDRRARRSELLGCMTLPLPLSQDKEATWHPLEAGTGRATSSIYGLQHQDSLSAGRGSLVASPPLSKDGDSLSGGDNNNSAEDLTYLRHLELEPVDSLTGLPLHPGFTARGGRTPCTVTRRLVRQAAQINQLPWGFLLSWGRPPRVERIDPGSPAERSGLRPGDYVVFVESTNVVTQTRDDILELIRAATTQLILEVYRRGVHGHAIVTTGGTSAAARRRSSLNVTLQTPAVGVIAPPPAIAFTAEAFPNLAADAPPEEELGIRETRYWQCLKSGQARFVAPLAERQEILSSTDHLILFQNLDELLKLSEEIRDDGAGIDSYLSRVPRITAAYRRYLGGLQRACCLLVALRKNSSFAKIVCEPAVPRRRKPDLTGVLIQPLEHYREMTRLLSQACPRSCQPVRDLAQGYRESTASAGVMEPLRDNGRPLLSLQEVESRLVFARCKPFALAVPGRQWLFGGALSKVEGRGRSQPTWALLLTDLLVFARVSRDRVLFVTEEPLRLACIAEACFTVRKRPTEFRLQVTTQKNNPQPSAPSENPSASTELVQCAGTGGGSGGCSPHSRTRRRLIILRAPSAELKAVWHNLLQRQIIYVNTGYGGSAGSALESPDDDSPKDEYLSPHSVVQRERTGSSEVYRSTQQLEDDHHHRQQRANEDSLDQMLRGSSQQGDIIHLAQWVCNSHQIPPPDLHEAIIEEWTAEELAARTPSKASGNDFFEGAEESTVVNSDAEQQSSASSASLSTVKSNSLPPKKNGSGVSSRETSSGSINICRKCHSNVRRRSGCPTPPPIRDPFSPLPPRISVVPPTPDLCSKHRSISVAAAFRNGLHDSPAHSYSADGTTEDGSEDDLDCDGELPYRNPFPVRRALRRFGTLSSLDQDDELEDQTTGGEDEGPESPPSGLRAWTLRASSYVVSKMSIFEHLTPPAPPERTDSSNLEAPGSNGDEEGTTSGGTSENDIWGTPTSGGPDDESFAGSPPPMSNGPLHRVAGEDNYGLDDEGDEDDNEPDNSGDNDDCGLPELTMEQLLGGATITTSSVGVNSMRSFLGRRRLEPLPEEDDSISTGSGVSSGGGAGGGGGGAGKMSAGQGWW